MNGLPLNNSHQLLTLSDYERKMKKFENCSDGYVIPDMFVVVRIDAHRLNKELWKDFEDDKYPLSREIYKALLKTAQYIMCAESSFSMAFIHGDEISVLFDAQDRANERRRARLVSLVASAGTAGFISEFGKPVLFHAKLSELPTVHHVIDYFLWQRKVAERNFYSRTLGIKMAEANVEKQIIVETLNKPPSEMELILQEYEKSGSDYSEYLRFGGVCWWNQGIEEEGSVLNYCSELDVSDEAYFQFLTEAVKFNGKRMTNGTVGVRVLKFNKEKFKGRFASEKVIKKPVMTSLAKGSSTVVSPRKKTLRLKK